MATFGLPPPQQLEIHNCNAADKWMRFELAWSNYSAATQLDEKSEHVQVATLLTVIGEERERSTPPLHGQRQATARKLLRC